jgi:membrane protein
VEVPWRHLWVGAAVTALLFSIGRFLIGFYLGSSGISSTYGAAGSLVVILIWVFYSAQILLLGAEFTQVYAKYCGAPIQPSPHAVSVAETSTTETSRRATHQAPRSANNRSGRRR